MATASVPLQSLREGQVIKLTERDGYRCQGKVHKVDLGQRLVKLKDVVSLETKVREPGIQVFAQTDIQTLDLVDDSGAAHTPTKYEGSPSRTGWSVSRSERRQDNPHLHMLIHLDMPGLLEQKQMEPVPELPVLSLQPGRPRALPAPKQDYYHMEGEKFKDRLVYEFRTVREVCWPGMETPPDLKCVATELHMISNEEDEAWSVAVAALESEKSVGLSMAGQSLGRNGKLSVISVATKKSVFLFDFVALPDLLDEGTPLRKLLESTDVMKVVHDGRQIADLLEHQFKFRLKNVYDTLAAHLSFIPWALYAGFMPRNAASHNNLVRNYLGVATRCLHFPHIRYRHQDEDSAIWLQRPLTPELELGAACNAMFLLDLQRQTRTCMNSAFRRTTEALQGALRDASAIDAGTQNQCMNEIPDSVRKVLPDWGPKPRRVQHLGLLEQEERWIHNTVGQIDPNLIFSRDCLHQKKERRRLQRNNGSSLGK